MKYLLKNTNRLRDLTVLKETILFLRDTQVKEGFESPSYDFCNEFIKEIAQGDRSKIDESLGLVLFRNKS